jgi:hypothetical protein
MRRFQFSGTEFSSLQDQVKQLLGLNREFVLKYKDNEDDMITISSTEELACAIDISQKGDAGLIRLTVVFPETSTTPIPCVDVPVPSEHGRDTCPRGRGRGGRWNGGGPRFNPEGGPRFNPEGGPRFNPEGGLRFNPEGGLRFNPEGGPRFNPEGGPHHHASPDQRPCNRYEKRRDKLTFKRDLWKAYLSSLDQIKELSPEEERKKQLFQGKVQRLDSILAHFAPKENPGEKTEFCPPKEMCYRHFEKKSRKWEKKVHKEGKKKEAKNSNLSEEAKAEIKILKSQIKEMKPALWAIKEQLKAKKLAVRAASEAGQQSKIPELKNEIGNLKREKWAKKEQIEPLCQRVHQLKSGK